MELLSHLQQAALNAQDIRAKGGAQTMHRLISADDENDAAAQARAYARALIAHGKLSDAPREFDCDQPTSDYMLLEFFKGAKNTLLIFTGIGHLARQETFEAEISKAFKRNCAVVICGKTKDMDVFLAQNPDIKNAMPQPFAMAALAVQREIAQNAAQDAQAAEEKLTNVKLARDIKPLSPIHVVRKPPRP